MALPKQSPPIKRPHFVQPHECIDVTHGRPEDLLRIRMELLEGSNYNDPAPFRYPGYGSLKWSAFSASTGQIQPSGRSFVTRRWQMWG